MGVLRPYGSHHRIQGPISYSSFCLSLPYICLIPGLCLGGIWTTGSPGIYASAHASLSLFLLSSFSLSFFCLFPCYPYVFTSVSPGDLPFHQVVLKSPPESQSPCESLKVDIDRRSCIVSHKAWCKVWIRVLTCLPTVGNNYIQRWVSKSHSREPSSPSSNTVFPKHWFPQALSCCMQMKCES